VIYTYFARGLRGEGMEEAIDLKQYLNIIHKKAWVIVLITVMAIMISAAVNIFLVLPVYESSTTMMVSRAIDTNDANIRYQDILISQRLVHTYGVIARSNRVLSKVVETLGLNMTVEEMRGKVSVTSMRDTEIIRISVLSTNGEFAANLANAVAQVFMQEVVSIMRIDNVQLIDEARIPAAPVKPRLTFNIAIAGVLGIMLGLALVFFIEFMDNTIKASGEIEKRLDLPVLGVIPRFDS
jgi:capsular polysaccharide biosynthesis protein